VTQQNFSLLIEQLQDDYQILALDLPGFGGSQTLSLKGTQDYAKFVKDWLKRLFPYPNMLSLVIPHMVGAVAITAPG